MTSCQIRPFTEADIAPALQLCRQAGWNQLRADWLRLIRYQSEGCFVAVSDGEVAGTVTATCYGRELAWIGMMLVDPKLRRRGVATALMSASIDALKDLGTDCIKLDATPVGQHVYRKLEFIAEWSFQRWELVVSGRQHDRSDRADDALNEQHLTIDRQGFGVDRRGWLDRLAADSQVQANQDGYGMMRAGHLASYLGPVVAKNAASAAQIIRSLIPFAGGKIFWDVPQPNTAAVRIAESLGFRPVRDLTRMSLGPSQIAPELDWQYALSDPGTG